MNQEQQSLAAITDTRQRLFERAKAYIEHAYQRTNSMDAAAIVERSKEPDRRPFIWTMQQAAAYKSDVITQAIPERVKNIFVETSRLVAIAARSRAVAIVAEVWCSGLTRLPGETDDEFKARGESIAREGAFYQDDRTEAAAAFLQWIKGGTIHHAMYRWELIRERRHVQVGKLIDDTPGDKVEGRFANILLSNDDIPDEVVTVARMGLKIGYNIEL